MFRGRGRRVERGGVALTMARRPSISSAGRYSSLGLSLDAAQRRLWALEKLGAERPPLKAAAKAH